MKKLIVILLGSIFSFLILFNLCLFNFNLFAKKRNQISERNLNDIIDHAFEYKVQEHLKPKDLIGISNEQIDDHWKLYKGYVDQVNKLNKELFELRAKNKGNGLDYADRRRRYGFEYNGMVLHEYYFGNLCLAQGKLPSCELLDAIKTYFGSFENWKNDFKNTGKTRGIGWAILFMDSVTGNLINAFVQDHEVGNIAGFQPILVMDVWEHAYMVDYFAGERANYIDAFMKNINWPIINQRFEKAKNKEIFSRF